MFLIKNLLLGKQKAICSRYIVGIVKKICFFIAYKLKYLLTLKLLLEDYLHYKNEALLLIKYLITPLKTSYSNNI